MIFSEIKNDFSGNPVNQAQLIFGSYKTMIFSGKK